MESYYRRVVPRLSLGENSGAIGSLTSSLACILVSHSTPVSGSLSTREESRDT